MRTDTPIYVARRKSMCMMLRTKICNEAVLAALEKVPRQMFMPESLASFAYENKAYPIGCGQTISHPYTVALQTELLDLEKGNHVLEIGTGSGYQTAVLCEMGAHVCTIERQKELYAIVTKRLHKLGYKVDCYCGDGYEGLPLKAPFDKIIVTAGASEMPQTLLKQLKIGGIMVLPFGDEQMHIYKITRLSECEFRQEKKEKCEFVPFLKGIDDKPIEI